MANKSGRNMSEDSLIV